MPRRWLWAVLAGLLALAVTATPAAAYVGPGAGFALVSSFLVMLTTGLLAFLSLVAWPFRMAWRLLRRVRAPKARVRRFIVLGLDGQDPLLTDRFLSEGKLPNFQRLAALGCYHRLRTTFPSVSPVAWSSFSTGTNPSRHNIFDFLDRDRRSYLPVLSSARIGPVRRTLNVGRFRIPLRGPEIRLLRKSKPFWAVLGEHHVWSTILRVPITFPPDRFYGAQLSAMSVPDLLGTQGTFTLYTTRPTNPHFKEGGRRVAVQRTGGRIETVIEGPPNELLRDRPRLTVPLAVELGQANGGARVVVDGTAIRLQRGELSEWISLRFRAAPGVAVRGICRMAITEMDEHFSLYVSPLHMDPERPPMPISHPSYYAIYLAKQLGPYATLGLAEDTWALNEGVIDDEAFLKFTYDIDREREGMFFAALDKLRRGVMVCVFDATDRIQHMFWRYLEPGHPAATGTTRPTHHDAIERLYRHNDALVGKVLREIGEDDVLMVVSDHGFCSFRRGVNLNAWLHEHGYLSLVPGAEGRTEWLRDVDWAKTTAYALGLNGLYVNIKGREAKGVVEPGSGAQALKRELMERLGGLRDEETGETAICEVFDTAKLYDGPYVGNAPDMLIGYNRGYRASWDCATGVVAGSVFEANTKPWSGDHCVDPRLVPGVLFCNRPISRDDPALIDIAPTALREFGIEPPAYMDGRPLFSTDPL